MMRGIGLCLLMALATAAAFGVARAQQTQPATPPPAAAGQATPPGVILDLNGKPDPLPDAAFGATVKQQCSKCHVVPLPQYLPRGMWRLRIQEMAQRSLMGTGVTPGEESVLWQMDTSQFVRYFEARSPVTLPLPDPWPPGDGGLRFTHQLMNPKDPGQIPVIANTRFLDLDGDGLPEIVACDMGHGIVYLGEPFKKPGELREIARIPNPDHAAMVDFDGDGKQDLLIADLGDFMPGDHEKGSVVLLRQTDHLQFEKIVLVDHLARTADVEAADFNGDGKLDLVVAAFGWHTVGGIYVYENHSPDVHHPQFEGYPVDARPGGIHVIPVDLNHDGKMDFVGLISQQYEHVVAYLNRGPGKGFRPETIFRAITPVWGSSGIQLADIDGDGDLDLLMTNGDSLDDFTVRPFHGVRWFENQGTFPWLQHDLVAMPGVHRAQAVDMNGDGKLDIVCAAFLPNAEHPAFQLLERQGDLAPFTSIGWLEQTAKGVFVPHPLETGKLTHTTLDVGDFDGDGDIDIVTGNFVGFTFTKSDTGFKADTTVDLWVNQAKQPGAAGTPAPPRP
ncbi:MAG TPA: VCBS repeat-containing protein [Vicinamibacteria bacterium]|nr:VCBS repeat-containing protein [Vicinamibacteria bacterium]